MRGLTEFLRTEGLHAAGEARTDWRFLTSTVLAGTMIYGAAMGSFGLRPLQALYSALKVPLLVGAATLICLPSFFVLNTVLGLRNDFAAACRAIVAAQGSLAVVLASLAPITIVGYVSSGDYPFATALNGVMFLVAVTVAFFLGGVFALLIRLELLTPGPTVMEPMTYNRLFTLHGVVMVFLFMIPAIPSGFGNFLLPIMLGARDVAFPRLNLLSFYLYLAGPVRKVSASKVGDTVTIDLRFDAAYRNGPMHPMPEWFRRPLAADRSAKRGWDALAPSRQKEILRYLSWLKSPEARERNVTKAIRVLSGSKERYMVRSWSEGR